jgi:hypothetical protein
VHNSFILSAQFDPRFREIIERIANQMVADGVTSTPIDGDTTQALFQAHCRAMHAFDVALEGVTIDFAEADQRFHHILADHE